MTAVSTTADHPAKWSAKVLVALHDAARDEAERVRHTLSVLDPFAGVGRARLADALAPHAHIVSGVELQPEWIDAGTYQGDATDLHWWGDGSVNAVFSSPCYGNRCADSHDAKDPCKACGGQPIGVDPAKGEGASIALCKTCKGTGLSWRNTYAHALRRAGGEIVPGSAAAMQWGRSYRLLHRDALAEMIRVVVPGGLLAINMSNHIRDDAEQDVVGWWVNQIIVAGCVLRAVLPIETPRNRNGENREVRVDAERLILAHTPKPRRLL